MQQQGDQEEYNKYKARSGQQNKDQNKQIDLNQEDQKRSSTSSLSFLTSDSNSNINLEKGQRIGKDGKSGQASVISIVRPFHGFIRNVLTNFHALALADLHRILTKFAAPAKYDKQVTSADMV
ncbi:MAG: hypothetical protein EZS28_028821 [Streblomastix strix]|uniref:Uncharacterized protein n=1 Tax=Streblomastix strix TaxID=222440 RepID=A0A5J4UZR5_9EUKA|nr:MAG: hypothetical protein EZS28_028821 [Streblomastix strix]